LYFLFNAIFFNPMPGWSTIMVVLSLFFGIVFMILGTICEYLLRIYVESTRRPLYFIAADTTVAELGRYDRRRDEDRRTLHA
jgi:dolichol-phosphate mannosyltransferase